MSLDPRFALIELKVLDTLPKGAPPTTACADLPAAAAAAHRSGRESLLDNMYVPAYADNIYDHAAAANNEHVVHVSPMTRNVLHKLATFARRSKMTVAITI